MASSLELHRRIHLGVVEALRALALDSLLGGVQNETFLDETNLELPCVVASIEGEQEEILGGTTQKRHSKYPVRVFTLARDVLLPEEAGKILEWRERMVTRFDRPKRDMAMGTVPYLLPECPEVCDLHVIPKVIFDERLPQYKYVVSGFVVKAEAFFER